MKRDMEVIRDILLEAEKHDPAAAHHEELEVAGRDPHVVHEHAVLLEEAGYIVASFSMGNPPRNRHPAAHLGRVRPTGQHPG